MDMENKLNQHISLFPNAFFTDYPETISLWDYLNGGMDAKKLKVHRRCFSEKRIPAKYFNDFRKAENMPIRNMVRGYRNRIQQIGKTDKLAEFKKLLPAVTVSGEFVRRANDALIQHSGLIALDFDNVDDMHQVRTKTERLDFVAYVGLSISGTGFYVIIPIPKHETNEAHHQSYFALEKYFWEHFQLKTDKSCKDVARLRFYACDETPFFNPNALIFEDLAQKSVFEQENQTDKKVSNILHKKLYRNSHKTQDDFEQKFIEKRLESVLKSIENKILTAVDGEKNSVLLSQSKLLGGYISGSYLDYQTAFDFLEQTISKRNIKSISKARQTIENGLKYGQNQPIVIEIPHKSAYKMQQIEGEITAKIVFLTGIRQLYEHRNQLETCVLYVERLLFLRKSEMQKLKGLNVFLIPPTSQKLEYAEKLPQIRRYAQQVTIQNFTQITQEKYKFGESEKQELEVSVLQQFSDETQQKIRHIMEVLDLGIYGFSASTLDTNWEEPVTEECPF